MSSSTPPPGTMSRAITKLLIANRGEIAVRIARTAHRLGISTVGVYSEPDADAMHVDAVDVAVALGGSTPAESYLRADAIIEIALRHGCEAIHPGYGFLAENADVAERVVGGGADLGRPDRGSDPDPRRQGGGEEARHRVGRADRTAVRDHGR